MTSSEHAPRSQSDGILRNTYEAAGTVQGVGFRPAVHRLAVSLGLGGWIQNRAGTVRLCLEGPDDTVADFLRRLPAELPPGAELHAISLVDSRRAASTTADFRIIGSEPGDPVEVVIPADLAMCAACESDIADPANRRFAYPFTTCAHCGPRYTIVRTVPFDRERTTMSRFELCPDCRREYEDPTDRRFHAETIACPRCGPRLSIEDAAGRPIAADVLSHSRAALRAGRILALRGIGGFHLVADALSAKVVAELRRRKRRPAKPFAVMAASPAVAARFCALPPAAERLLLSREAPIVILDLLPEWRNDPVLRALCADSATLGVFLPTTPLHRLLMTPPVPDGAGSFDLLVMTSGNRGGEPICISNQDARDRLAGIADLFVFHDRDIVLRNDDSICRVGGSGVQVWRRARGYAPAPIRLPAPLPAVTLAGGAELKNTVALGYERRIVLSPHVGDLDTPEALDAHLQAARALPVFLRRQPAVVAHDLHPDMNSTRNALLLAAELNAAPVPVQHHHAHAAACMAENALSEALALVFDGTGYGTDGLIWGAELLHVSDAGARRLATFAPAPLPGGDAAVRRPARQLIARLHDAGAAVPEQWLARLRVSPEELHVCAALAAAPATPRSHSAGRLFDAVAAALGIAPDNATYDGQSAIRLESAARRNPSPGADRLPYAARIRGDLLVVDWAPTFQLLADPSEAVAARAAERPWAFHETLAQAALDMVRHGAQFAATRNVVLTGGCFMNGILSELLANRLDCAGFAVYTHHSIPPNDACVAVGQAIVAAAVRMKAKG